MIIDTPRDDDELAVRNDAPREVEAGAGENAGRWTAAAAGAGEAAKPSAELAEIE